jgi:hypothetical protein
LKDEKIHTPENAKQLARYLLHKLMNLKAIIKNSSQAAHPLLYTQTAMSENYRPPPSHAIAVFS